MKYFSVTSFEVAFEGFERTPLGRDHAATSNALAFDGFDRTPVARIS